MNLYKRIYRYPTHGAVRSLAEVIQHFGLGKWLLIAVIIIGFLKAIF